MKLSLQEILSMIGASVQQAQHSVEKESVRIFLEQFLSGEADSYYSPRMIRMGLPSSNQPGNLLKDVEMPVSALFQHKAMHLSEVQLQLQLIPCESSGELAFQIGVKPTEEQPSSSYSQLNLTYQCGDSPEGIARLHQHTTQIL